jgi:hypothetical protein
MTVCDYFAFLTYCVFLTHREFSVKKIKRRMFSQYLDVNLPELLTVTYKNTVKWEHCSELNVSHETITSINESVGI